MLGVANLAHIFIVDRYLQRELKFSIANLETTNYTSSDPHLEFKEFEHQGKESSKQTENARHSKSTIENHLLLLFAL